MALQQPKLKSGDLVNMVFSNASGVTEDVAQRRGLGWREQRARKRPRKLTRRGPKSNHAVFVDSSVFGGRRVKAQWEIFSFIVGGLAKQHCRALPYQEKKLYPQLWEKVGWLLHGKIGALYQEHPLSVPSGQNSNLY